MTTLIKLPHGLSVYGTVASDFIFKISVNQCIFCFTFELKYLIEYLQIKFVHLYHAYIVFQLLFNSSIRL